MAWDRTQKQGHRHRGRPGQPRGGPPRCLHRVRREERPYRSRRVVWQGVFFLLHCFAGDGKLSTCTHAASQCPPDGHLAIGNGISQGTGIDIDNEMLDSIKIIEAQTVDQRDTRPAHSDDLGPDGRVFINWRIFRVLFKNVFLAHNGYGFGALNKISFEIKIIHRCLRIGQVYQVDRLPRSAGNHRAGCDPQVRNVKARARWSFLAGRAHRKYRWENRHGGRAGQELWMRLLRSL